MHDPRFSSNTPSDIRAAREAVGLPFQPAGNAPSEGAPFSRQVPAPWISKFPSSRDFNRNDFSLTLPAVAGFELTSPLLRVQIPGGTVGWVQIFGLYVLTPTALASVRYALRVNRAPVEGYDNIDTPPGVANFIVQNFSDIQIRIPNGGLVDIAITNLNGNGPWTVGGKIAGYFHPKTEEDRIYGTL